MIVVNKDLCIGCGTCAALCPMTFQIGADGKSEVFNQDDVVCAENAKSSCPVQAIDII